MKIEVCAIRENEGGFSCFAPELPGVVAQGDTLDQAFAEMRCALGLVLDVYGGVVPWAEVSGIEDGAIVERRILEFEDEDPDE